MYDHTLCSLHVVASMKLDELSTHISMSVHLATTHHMSHSIVVISDPDLVQWFVGVRV